VTGPPAETRPPAGPETTQGADVGPVVPAPWQVERVGAAWRAVYDRAHDVTAAWLMTEHATPGLTEKLQALSVALMTLDQRRLATFAPSEGDTFTWKARAEHAEAALAELRARLNELGVA